MDEEPPAMKKGCWRRMGVEPVLFLYMSAFMLTSVVEQALYVDKACRVNLGFPKNVCDHIKSKENLNYSHQVQVEVAMFHQYQNIVSNAIPVLLAFFLGAWSDKVGRKIPLMLGLAGNFIFSAMVVVNALQDSWDLNVILYSACLPCGLTGGNLTVFMAAFSYLADTTSQKERTLRITILEVCYLLPMPIGVALGAYLFKVLNGSFAAMFGINAILLLASLVCAGLFLERKTTDWAAEPEDRACFWGLFDWKLAVDSVRTMLKPREGLRRRYLLLVLLAMAFFVFQRDESQILYLYTQLKFQWGVTDFSKFRTFQSSLYIAGLLLGVPVLGRVLTVPDTLTLMTGALSHVTARLFFATSDLPSLLYVGGGFGLLGPVIAPVLRSVTSKLVPSSERGKVFAMFTVADTSVPLVSGVVFTQVYTNTIRTFPQAFFLVTIATQSAVFLLALYIHVSTQGENIVQAKETSEEIEKLRAQIS